jgi:A/G-specific adenine glycosylase
MKIPVIELLAWYRSNRRDLPWRKTNDIYSIWVSEIMLQQTQVTTVIPYYHRFLDSFPTVEHLARAEEQEVLKQWEGLGYYSRARNLHRAAKIVMEQYRGRIPGNPGEFKTLPGVGPYVAAAVLSIARGLPLPVVDGNVMRVVTRFRGIDEDIRKNRVREQMVKELRGIIPGDSAGDFNQAMMELGASICTPKHPQCSTCPLSTRCTAYQTRTIHRYPYKSPLRDVPEYNVSIGIIIKEGKFYIQKRPSEGHLGGMWEFPGGKARENESPEQALNRECREETGAEIDIVQPLALVHHAYSHFKIHMSVFICRLKQGDVQPPPNQPFQWITAEELERYPFPGANHKFFPALKAFFSKP